MWTRKIGKLLRGRTTPRQVVLATVLGGLLGFVPGFALVSDLGGGLMQAPGLILTLIFLVVVLNANLTVFGITLIGAKVLSIILMPVSFWIGRGLLDGPTSGLFELMINAPVLAWFGLEHYATSGGLVTGAAFGAGVGVLTLRGIRAFRTRMAGVEEGSELYERLTARRSVRFLTWVFLGKGKGKKSYLELLESDRKGLPIRIPGVVLVAVVTLGLWLGLSFLSGPALHNALQGGLESYNGATVDLAGVEVDLGAGRIAISGLAMADAGDLIRDTFRARTLEMKLGTDELLRKRLVIDSITSQEASTGELRERPGVLLVDPELPPPPPPEPGSKTLEDYLQDAEVWKDRLQQVARWLEKLSGADEVTEEEEEAIRDERIDRVAREQGLARVVASHLIEGSPRVLIRSLVFEGVLAVDLQGDLLDIRASNLSTSPRLVEEPVTLSIGARSGTFSFDFRLDAKTAKTADAVFAYRGLPVDEIAGQLRSSPIRGGTMDVSLSAAVDFSRPSGAWIDFPLVVHLHDTNLGLEGAKETRVDDLRLTLGLKGPLRAPSITIDDQGLADALVAAGKRELADRVRGRAGGLIEERVPPDVAQRAQDTVRGILPGGLPGGLLGGRETAPPVPETAFGHWVHSFEEDGQGEEVYRRSGYAFRDSQSRRGFEMRAGGEFVEHPLPPGTAVQGRWTAQDGQVRVEFPGTGQEGYTFRIVTADGDVLKIGR